MAEKFGTDPHANSHKIPFLCGVHAIFSKLSHFLFSFDHSMHSSQIYQYVTTPCKGTGLNGRGPHAWRYTTVP